MPVGEPSVALPLEAGIVVKDHVQQGIVDFELAVITDEPELAKLIREEAHARSRHADHFRERLLTEFRYDRLWLPLLAKVRHQEKQPG
jgi:hypothetical protein